MFSAKVIADSYSYSNGVRLTTLQLRYPRIIHAEFMTHRVFSRNASSSRAIPVAKMLEQVRKEPAMPIHWGKNQPGMQAREELSGAELHAVKNSWMRAAENAVVEAELMMEFGAHKQVVNRILEPFQFINVVVTATEWSNFFELRDHEDADPNIQALARVMREAMDESEPQLISSNPLKAHGWHLPYITLEERVEFWDQPLHLAKLSSARCARTSYLTFEGVKPESEKDLQLFDRLVGSKPLHASPTEHPACALNHQDFCRNFRGYRQFRVLVEEGMEEVAHHPA